MYLKSLFITVVVCSATMANAQTCDITEGVCQKFKQHAQNGQKFLAQGNTLGGIVINK